MTAQQARSSVAVTSEFDIPWSPEPVPARTCTARHELLTITDLGC